MVTELHNPDTLLGALIDGKYRIVEKIGGGGMGVVYKATHELMGRTVAMKLLHRHLIGGEADQQFLDRFFTEARASSRIEHPNAITIHDFGIHEVGPYLVMQYVEGTTLRSIVRSEGALPLRRILLLTLQMCSALNEAHRLGIIHRDLKPDNIVVARRNDGEERAVVLDFGIAKMLGADGANNHLTQDGKILGTPTYMAPEQVRGAAALDARSDLYSIGVILYELCTGNVPFESDSAIGLMMCHLNERPAAFHTLKNPPSVPAELEQVVMKALQKDPSARQRNIRELAEDLEEIARIYAPGLVSHVFRRDTLGGVTGTSLDQVAVKEAPAGQWSTGQLSRVQWKQLLKQKPLMAGASTLGMVAVGALFFLLGSGTPAEQAPKTDTAQVKAAIPLLEPADEPIQYTTAGLNSGIEPKTPPADSPPSLPPPPAQTTPPEISAEAEAVFSQARQAQLDRSLTEAERLYKQVMVQAPTYAKTYHYLGDVYISLKRYSDAVIMLKRATELSPDDAAAYSTLAYAYGELGRFAESVSAYKETIRIKPDYALAHNNLGFTYLKLNLLNEAETAFKRSLTLDSSYAKAWFNLAELYQRRNDWRSAITAHLGGVQADPGNAPAYVALGSAYERLGERQKAIEAYRKALELKPLYPKARAKLRELNADY